MSGGFENPNGAIKSVSRSFNIENSYLRIGDNLNTILENVHANVSAASGALYDFETCCLALASAFQISERMDDGAASEATRLRSDWRYALYFSKDHPGVTPLRLCEFRQVLFASDTPLTEFSVFLQYLSQYGLTCVSERTEKPVADTISNSCKFSWFTHLVFALRNAISHINTNEKNWNQVLVLPYRFERYFSKNLPISVPAQQDFLDESDRLGKDIAFLLSTVRSHKNAEFHEPKEIRTLDLLFSSQMNFHDEVYSWKPPVCSNCAYYSRIKGGELSGRIH